jgi:hypothetical protein
VERVKPQSLYLQGMSPRYPIYRRLYVPQSRSGRGHEEKRPLFLPRIETVFSNPKTVTSLTELSRIIITVLLQCGVLDHPGRKYPA